MNKIQSADFGVPEYDMNREGTYRPRVSPEHLRQLWKTKQENGKPITEVTGSHKNWSDNAAPDKPETKTPETPFDPKAPIPVKK